MSARISAWFHLIYEKAGAVIAEVGSLGNKMYDVIVAGDQHKAPGHFSIPAGTGKTVWFWTDVRDFEVLIVRLVASGNAFGWYLADTSVSGSDLSPSGANRRARNFELSCQMPFVFQTDQCRINTDVATDVGWDPVTGIPAAAGHANTVLGKVYGVYIWNPGTTPITCSLSLFN